MKRTRPYSILVIEDNESDVFLLERALNRQHLNFQLTHLKSATEAYAFIRREGPYAKMPRPDMILADWNLPPLNGEEIIRQIRSARHFYGVATCIWSSSESFRSFELQNHLHFYKAFFKPAGLAQFMKIGKIVKHLLLRRLPTRIPAFT